jgi:protein-disulfide isomerase
MKNLPLLIATLLGTLLFVVGIAFFFSKSSEPQKADHALVMNNVQHVRGAQNPKVTIVEFSDLQCPACKGYQPLIAQLLEKYPNDVQLVYRHFPLVSIHPHAQLAAEAAEAAHKFGKFWEMHDLLFQTQDDWAELKNDEEVLRKFDELVTKLQIDKNEFRKTIETQEVRDRVKLDMADGVKLNVNGTPTFYINDQLITAPQLVSAVESIITANK